MSTGYANRITHLDFSHELAEPKLDADGNRIPELEADGEPKLNAAGEQLFVPSEAIWVSMRNPKTMPIDDLIPRTVATNPETGQAIDEADAQTAMYEVFVRMTVGWRAYDATDFSIDPETGKPLDQRLLPSVVDVDHIRKLPAPILSKIGATVQKAANPN